MAVLSLVGDWWGKIAKEPPGDNTVACDVSAVDLSPNKI
jgi:hypothetical protein